MKKRIIIILSLLMLAISAIFIANLKSTKANEQIANSEENQISKEIKDLTKKEGIKFAYTYQGAPTNLDLDDLISGVGVTYSATLTCTNGTTGTIENGHVKITNISIPSECSIDFDDVTTYQVTLTAANSSEGTQQKNIIAGSSDTFTVTPSSGYTLTGATVSCTQAAASINTSTGVVTVSNVTQTQTCTVTLPSDLPTYVVTFDVNGGDAWTNSTCTSPSTLSGTACTKTVVSTQTYGALPTPTRSNYSFDGWYTYRQNGSGNLITDTSTVSISANQTLYAHWTEHPTVTMAGANSYSSGDFSISSSSAEVHTRVGITMSYMYVAPGDTLTFTITPKSGYTLTDATISCTQATASLNTSTGVVTISNVTESQICNITLGQVRNITYSSFTSATTSPTAGQQPTQMTSIGSTTFTFSTLAGVGNLRCSANKISCSNATCTATTTTCQNSNGQNKSCKLITISNATGNVTITCSSWGTIY